MASYTTLAEDLASRGYVVVGFDAPFRTTLVVLPDGTIRARTRENDPERASDDNDQRRIVERFRLIARNTAAEHLGIAEPCLQGRGATCAVAAMGTTICRYLIANPNYLCELGI